MINLKLAEYKDGKFERFLELGKDFGYFEDFISVASDCSLAENLLIETDEWALASRTVIRFRKDEKDPLSRFDGLFDDRTYGEGRFVLIEGFKFKEKIIWEDDVLGFYNELIKFKKDFVMSNCGHGEQSSMNRIGFYFCNTDTSFKGNLHKNPELFLGI